MDIFGVFLFREAKGLSLLPNVTV